MINGKDGGMARHEKVYTGILVFEGMELKRN